MALIWLWITLVVANIFPLVDGGAKRIYLVIRSTLKKEDKSVLGEVQNGHTTTDDGITAVTLGKEDKSVLGDVRKGQTVTDDSNGITAVYEPVEKL